jgi:hypothetical protein
VLSLFSKADRRSARAAPLRCSDRACWNNRQVIPEILETYCNEKAEPRQKSTLDADSQRNHTQIVPFSANVVMINATRGVPARNLSSRPSTTGAKYACQIWPWAK